MIKLKNVTKYYNYKGVVATGLSRINLNFKIGEFVAITGESGSGKTTLINVLSGLDSYEEGELYINGSETSHYSDKDFEDYRRTYVSNIYQNFNLITSYTVYQNIELVLLLNGFNSKEIKNKVLDLIDKVNMTKFKNTKVSKLSGGQKQRVAIARALAKDTPIIIADEPTGNLDSKQASEVLELLHKISNDKLVIVVTHDYELIKDYTSRKIRMSDGKVLEDKYVKVVELKESSVTAYNQLTRRSKSLLVWRNVFNVFPKFVLLLIVFLLLTTTIITEYAYSKKQELEVASGSFNALLGNIDESRLILKKNNKEPITDDEISYLNDLTNVKRVVDNDTLLDQFFYIEDQLFLNGSYDFLHNISAVDVGSLPTNMNEVVIKVPEYVRADNLIEKKINLNIDFENILGEVIVTGIIFSENYETVIYLDEELFESYELESILAKSIYDVTLKVDNEEINSYYILAVSDALKEGEIAIGSGLCSDCTSKNVNIIYDGVYYQENITLNSVDLELANSISVYLNKEDAKKIFYKDNYQVSLFVEDMRFYDDTINDLENLGYEVFSVRDSLTSYNELGIIKIFTTVSMVILVIVLFLISYFVVSIIMKSRNVYFATIRMLGTDKKSCRHLLIGELIVVAFISFLIFLILVYSPIEFELFDVVSRYLYWNNYLFLLSSILFLSFLIGIRYSKKLFKKTAITTINEEV